MPVAEDVTDVGLLTVVPGKEYAKRLVMAEPDDCRAEATAVWEYVVLVPLLLELVVVVPLLLELDEDEDEDVVGPLLGGAVVSLAEYEEHRDVVDVYALFAVLAHVDVPHPEPLQQPCAFSAVLPLAGAPPAPPVA